MEWIKKSGFWILLSVEVCMGVLWHQLPFLMNLLFPFFFIWLNYYLFTSDMKKMLILDVVLVVATQAGMRYEYYNWLQTTEVIDFVGASLMQLGYILFFMAHGFFINAMMSLSFFRKKQKVAGCITGSIALIGILFFGILAVFVRGDILWSG